MFYERFIQLCKDNNEKPTNVLKSIGVSSGNLNNWKNGTSVKSDILVQLSEHFNVTTDYLLGKEKNEFTKLNVAEKLLLKMFNSFSDEDKIEIIQDLQQKKEDINKK